MRSATPSRARYFAAGYGRLAAGAVLLQLHVVAVEYAVLRQHDQRGCVGGLQRQDQGQEGLGEG